MTKQLVRAISILFLHAISAHSLPLVESRIKMNNISFGVVSEPAKMDPAITWKTHEFLIIQCLYQTLFRIDENNRLEGYLANKWSFTPDGKELMISIAADTKFSDGSALDSKDVAYSLGRHSWDTTPSVIKNYLGKEIVGFDSTETGKLPKGIQIVDKQTIKILLENRYPTFLQILTMPGFSISKYINNSNFETIGSGPYFISQKKDDAVYMKKNKFFNSFELKSPELEFHFIKSQDHLLEAFSKGKIDVSTNPSSNVGLLAESNDEISLTLVKSLSSVYTFINPRRPINDVLEVRKAAGQLIRSILYAAPDPRNILTPQHTFIPPGLMPHNYYERRGVTNGSDKNVEILKQYVKKNGVIELVVFSNLFELKHFQQIAAQFSKHSSIINLKVLSNKDFIETLKRGGYDICFFPYIGNFADPSGFFEVLKPTAVFGPIVESEQFFAENNKISPDLNKSDRLAAIAKAIRKYEDQWHIAPVFQMKLSILHNKKIVVPDTTFRYEAELWNFIWGSSN